MNPRIMLVLLFVTILPGTARGDDGLACPIVEGGFVHDTYAGWTATSIPSVANMIVADIGGEEVQFLAMNYSTTPKSQPVFLLFRKRGDDDWQQLPGGVGFLSDGLINLVLDANGTLHVICGYFDLLGYYLQHIWFPDPLNSDEYEHLDTDPVLPGPGAQISSGGVGVAYDGETAIWAAFSDTTGVLRAAFFNLNEGCYCWNQAEVVGSFADHRYTAPSVVALSLTDVRILTSRRTLTGSTYDAVALFRREGGQWFGSTIATAPNSTGRALYGSDLVETPYGALLGLVYSDPAFGGPTPTKGLAIVRAEGGWLLANGEQVGDGNQSYESNLYVDVATPSRIWVATTEDDAVYVESRAMSGATWSEPVLIAADARGLLTAKRKSGSDGITGVRFFYTAFISDPIAFKVFDGHVGPMECPADLDCDGLVGFDELLAVLSTWGPCVGCAEDLNGDGTVGFDDLLAVLEAWGPCPPSG